MCYQMAGWRWDVTFPFALSTPAKHTLGLHTEAAVVPTTEHRCTQPLVTKHRPLLVLEPKINLPAAHKAWLNFIFSVDTRSTVCAGTSLPPHMFVCLGEGELWVTVLFLPPSQKNLGWQPPPALLGNIFCVGLFKPVGPGSDNDCCIQPAVLLLL